MTVEGWTVAQVQDVFEIQLGKMLNKEAAATTPTFPYLGNREVQWGRVDLSDLRQMHFSEGERKKFLLRHGDLLVCEGGEVGRTALWRETFECYFQKAVHRLRPLDRRTAPEYMLHFMRFAASSGRLADFTSQSSIAHLTREKLAQVEVLLPPRGEQRKIAAILSSVDDAIEATQAVIDQLQVVKKAIMAEVCDSHTWPMHTIGSLIAEHGGEVRTGPFGTVLRAEEQDPSGTPLVSVREIRDGFIEVVADTPRVPETVVRRLPQFVLAEGDIVFARKRAVDRCAVVGATESGWMMGSDCIRVRLPPCMDPWFSGFLLRTKEARTHILDRSVGSTTMVTLTQGTLESVRIPVPPMVQQRQIARRLRSVEIAAEANAATLRQSRLLKSALMSVLLTGEVRVTPDEDAA